MKFGRKSGILLHPTSLPGDYGIGTFGKEAFDFVDFLSDAEQKLWQILPLGPTGYGESPYQCFSSAAGNPLLISLEKLVEDNLLNNDDLKNYDTKQHKLVNYEKTKAFKMPLLLKAYKAFVKKGNNNNFELFCTENAHWLDDFSLYLSLKEEFGQKPWNRWKKEIRQRTPEALSFYTDKLKEQILFQIFVQYIFFNQWMKLKKYANSKGIKIIGDMPLYVAYDSVEAWTSPQNFILDENSKPLHVAGVPPDYFSKTGQLWGNPVYNWEHLEKTKFEWWIERVSANLKLYDIIRIDHFRGLSAYWSIPYGEKTAVKGKWVKASGKKMFDALKKEFTELPFIAEDLGVITPDVEELRDHFDFPGMKILQFAFDSNEENEYLPHTFNTNCVVYTGTHDNNTTKGWFDSISAKDKKFVKEYIGSLDEGISKTLIRMAWASKADFSIAPLQDLLDLDEKARMNLPGTHSKNWIWKFKHNDLNAEHAKWLKELTKTYNR